MHGNRIGKIGRDTHWTEQDLERWLLNESRPLPDGKPLLFVSWQKNKQIQRVVDLLALDAAGGLVLIEVKNETSSRTVIGQALEYLSQYDGMHLSEIADDHDRQGGPSLATKMRERFGTEITELSSQRRVIIMAPSFDLATGVCLRFLGERMRPSNVSFEAIKARRTDAGFALSAFDPPVVHHSRQLIHKAGLTPRGRVYFVLDGKGSTLWNVGRWTSDGQLTPITRTTANKRALVSSRRLIDAPDEVVRRLDLTNSGATYVRRLKRSLKHSQHAKVIGVVTTDTRTGRTQNFVFVARFNEGEFQYFQRIPEQRFITKWQRTDQSFPDWPELLALSRTMNAEPARES